MYEGSHVVKIHIFSTNLLLTVEKTLFMRVRKDCSKKQVIIVLSTSDSISASAVNSALSVHVSLDISAEVIYFLCFTVL
jgi:hypothetical protein